MKALTRVTGPWVILFGLFLILASLVPALPARGHDPGPDDPHARIADRFRLGGKNAQAAPRRGVLARNMELVGKLQTLNPAVTPGFDPNHPARIAPGGRAVGFNGDVFVHQAGSGKTFAYVGTWGRRLLDNTTFLCPGAAIKIVDISNPANPVQVASAVAPAYAGSTSEDMEVRRVTTTLGEMDLLATGLQRCMNEGMAGASFWNVTDPTNPIHLSFFDVGNDDVTGAAVCLDSEGNPAVRGVHEIHLFQKGGRVYALLPLIFREATIAGVASEENCGPEFVIVDVTNPMSPTKVADWGAKQNRGLDPTTGLLDRKPNQGDFDRLFAHSVNTNADRSLAFVSYWDLGALIFDISGLSENPAVPTTSLDLEGALLGMTGFVSGEEGNTHSAEPAMVGGTPLLLTADEDCVGPPSGFLRIFDISDPAAPVQVGTFQTPHSQGGAPEDQVGAFCIHIPVVKGTKVATAWYANGVRMLDISNPAAPVQKGFLVPPPTPDPFGVFATNSWVWGATFAEIGGQEFIVASDVNFGLYVMREK